jgi:uncharacterized membrane protein
MTPHERLDDVDRTAARIVEESVVATSLETARETIVAAISTSITVNRGRRLAKQWQSLAIHERLRCLTTLAVVALAGNLAMASMLPPQIRPNVLLMAGAFVLIMLAVAAETIRRRS